MPRMILTLALLAVGFSFVPPPSPATIQNIPRSEVSGAVNIGGDRVLLVADEGYDVQIVSNAEATFKAGDQTSFAGNMKPAIPAAAKPKDHKKTIDDIEDVAWDEKAQAAFVITSHSRNKDHLGHLDKPGRYKLARLDFKVAPVEGAVVEVLREALSKKFVFVGPAMERDTIEGGEMGAFNIEGLAINPKTGSLLLGLRSPTDNAKCKSSAMILTLKNPHALFNSPAAAPEFEDQVTCLNLDGLGIRGMTYDAKRNGLWIVAGRSADPRKETATAVFSSLWFWNPAKPAEPPRKALGDLAGLVNIEAVSLLNRDNQEGLLLISDDSDASTNSRYLWVPIP